MDDAGPPALYSSGMIGRLNHVGVATPSIAESVKLYRDVLGATIDRLDMEHMRDQEDGNV